MTIDALLSQPPRQNNITRVGEIGSEAPHVMLTCTDASQYILLPMPIAIRSNDAPIWENSEVSTPQQTVAEAIKSQYEKDLFGQMKDKGAAISKLALTGNTDHAMKASGLAYHPLKELLFRGADFRKYSFQWDFVPLNINHAKALNKAIYVLQKYSLPPQSSGFMGYPSLWYAEFKPEKDFLPAFMESAITNIDIDYSASGKSAFHKDVIPIKISLTVEFTEVTIHTREKVEDGWWG